MQPDALAAFLTLTPTVEDTGAGPLTLTLTVEDSSVRARLSARRTPLGTPERVTEGTLPPDEGEVSPTPKGPSTGLPCGGAGVSEGA